MTRRKSSKIDWENIKVNIVKANKPNPQNPYSALTPEERREQLEALYLKIYLRIINDGKSD